MKIYLQMVNVLLILMFVSWVTASLVA